MKALILAADDNANPQELPICYTTTIGSLTLIEHTLRLLLLLGFKQDDITVSIGKKGVWENKRLCIQSNELLVENIGKKSFNSLQYFLSQYQCNKGLLVINGNSFFELKDLEQLICHDDISKALVEKRNNFYSHDIQVICERDIIVQANCQTPKVLPWFGYYGAMYLNQSDCALIKTKKRFKNISCIEAIVNDLAIKLKKIDIANNDLTYKNPLELVGGSFAGLSRVNLVKKQADFHGNEKLIMEIEWLNKLPENLKSKFPQIIDYNITPLNSYFTMPYYNLESLRKKIITGKFSVSQTLHYVEKILDYNFENLYCHSYTNTNDGWVQEKHFNRFHDRFSLIEQIKPFDRITKSQFITINSIKYPNLKEIIGKIEIYQQQTAVFTPQKISMIHGDLHFQNMLIDDANDDFLLMDPRGELKGSDIYYDLGKLWHSFDGLYDLIHTDIALAKINAYEKDNIDFTLDFGDKKLLKTYQQIKMRVENLILKYPISKDNLWELKIKFAQAMHFSSLMWFHLKNDGIENRALCLYLSAVILANNLYKDIQNLKKDNNEN